MLTVELKKFQILNKVQSMHLFDITIEDTSGTGNGAVLRPVVKDGKIDDVIVINTGIGYSTSATSIYIDQEGKVRFLILELEISL